MVSMARRIAGYPDAPSVPPVAELLAAVSSCEERLSSIVGYVAIGKLPERAYASMRQLVDARAASTALDLKMLLSEMDMILASVGLVADSRARMKP